MLDIAQHFNEVPKDKYIPISDEHRDVIKSYMFAIVEQGTIESKRDFVGWVIQNAVPLSDEFIALTKLVISESEFESLKQDYQKIPDAQVQVIIPPTDPEITAEQLNSANGEWNNLVKASVKRSMSNAVELNERIAKGLIAESRGGPEMDGALIKKFEIYVTAAGRLKSVLEAQQAEHDFDDDMFERVESIDSI